MQPLYDGDVPSLRSATHLGNYYPMHKSFVSIGAGESHLLAFLLNFAQMVECYDDEDQGWFFCTQETIERELGFGLARQSTLLKHLEDQGYIERKQTAPRNQPNAAAVRHIRMRLDAIGLLIEEWENSRQGGNTSELRTEVPAPSELRTEVPGTSEVRRPSYMEKRKKKKNGERGGFGISTSDDCDLEWARRLIAVMLQHDSISTTKHSAMQWAKQFRALRHKHEVSADRIEAVVSFLEVHYEDQYVAKIRSLKDLHGNFRRYEEAIARRCEEEGKTPPNKQAAIDAVEEWMLRELGIDMSFPQLFPLSPQELAGALKDLGLPAGTVTRDDWG